MGRGRGLTGAPTLRDGLVARRALDRLSATPLASLQVSTPLSARAPHASRRGSGWGFGVESFRKVIAQSLPPADVVEEVAPPVVQRRRRVSDLPLSADARPARGTIASRSQVGDQTGRSLDNHAPEGDENASAAALVSHRHPSSSTPHPMPAAQRPEVLNATRLPLGAASGTPAVVHVPTGKEIEWQHATTGPVRLPPRSHGHSGDENGGGSEAATTRRLAAIARGAVGHASQPGSNRRQHSETPPTKPGKAASVTSRRSRQQSLRSALHVPSTHGAQSGPSATRAPSIEPQAPSQPQPNSVTGRSASTLPQKREERVRGLAGLMRHLSDDGDNESIHLDSSAGSLAAASDAGPEERRTPSTMPPDRTHQDWLSVPRVETTGAADLDLGERIAALVGKALADEARRGGIRLQEAGT